MKIILLRHGRPELNQNRKLKAKNLLQWIDDYNSSGIDQTYPPSQPVMSIAKKSNTVVCSDYRRSIESATLLGLTKIDLIDPLFREAGLPHANWNSIKTSPIVWASVFRILWFMGYHPNSESYTEAQQRSINAASKLETLAAESDSVLFIGHGFMNRFISKQLLSNNWSCSTRAGRQYWAYASYEK